MSDEPDSTKKQIVERYVTANNRMCHAVADLVAVHRLFVRQEKDLDFAELDGDAIIIQDWYAAIRALAKASVEFDVAEQILEAMRED